MAQASDALTARVPDLSSRATILFPKVSRLPSEWHLRMLSGRLIASAFMSSFSGSHWHWVSECFAAELQCHPDEISEFEDNDGYLWITGPDGVAAGYCEASYIGPRPIDQRPVYVSEFLQAAE